MESAISVTNQTPSPEWSPEPHPEPSATLHDLDLPLREIPSPTVLFQCHGRKRGPLNFNPRSSARFNAPNGEYGTTYLSTSPEGAFIEKFLQQPARDTGGIAFVTRATLANHCLCECRIVAASQSRSLRLVDLTAHGLALIGADARLGSMTDDPGLTQRWALALWAHPSRPDGLIYLARHDPSRVSIALFDRAHHLLAADCSTNVLHRDDELNSILVHYRIGLMEEP